MKEIDAFTLPCPKPLVMAKKEIDAGNKEFIIKVDNEEAVDNLSRLALKKGLGLNTEEIDGGWSLHFFEGEGDQGVQKIVGNAQDDFTCATSAHGGYTVFVSRMAIGEGDKELGSNLIRMAMYTLTELDKQPDAVLFMNSGVKLLCGADDQIVEHVKTLEKRGVEIQVCGTCLDFYGIKDKLEVGQVSNMYDILGKMTETANVITL